MVVASTIGAIALVGVGAFLGIRASGNFGVVEQGLAYRSGQMGPGEIDAIVQEEGIEGRSPSALPGMCPAMKYLYRRREN
jgi:hypothetical protein